VRSANRCPVGQGEPGSISSGPGSGFGGGCDKRAEAAPVLGDGPFGGFAQVVPEVPPVRDLDGTRGADGGPFDEEGCPIPADHPYAWPLGEPGCQTGCLPVRKQIDGAAGFNVDAGRCRRAALTGGVLVNADHTRDGHLGLRKSVHQPEQHVAADRNPENAGDAGPGTARKGQTDRGQGRAQPLGLLTVPTCQPGYLLDEGRRAQPKI
jgi:hypothetical protein